MMNPSDDEGNSEVCWASTTLFSMMFPNSSISPIEIKMFDTTGSDGASSLFSTGSTLNGSIGVISTTFFNSTNGSFSSSSSSSSSHSTTCNKIIKTLQYYVKI